MKIMNIIESISRLIILLCVYIIIGIKLMMGDITRVILNYINTPLSKIDYVLYIITCIFLGLAPEIHIYMQNLNIPTVVFVLVLLIAIVYFSLFLGKLRYDDVENNEKNK